MLRKNIVQLILAIAFVTTTSIVVAQNQVVVIPLGGDGEPLTTVSMRNGVLSLRPATGESNITYALSSGGSVVSGTLVKTGSAMMSLVGPRSINGRGYAFSGITYCINPNSLAKVTKVELWGFTDNSSSWQLDNTLRDSTGCYTVDANMYTGGGYDNAVLFVVDGSNGIVFGAITSHWTLEP